VAQAGGFGGTTSIFMRGANSGQTRFMIDGVKVYDPISVNAAFDPTHLTTDNIDRIEVVKGPQSSLYGSDAIGGVINVLTKKGRGEPRFSVFGEAGSNYTSREGLNFSGEKDKLHFSFGASHLKTKGFSKAAKSLGNPERDPYENSAYSMRLDYDLTNNLSLQLINRYTYARYDLDAGGGAGQDDPNRTGWSKQAISSVVAEHKVCDLFKHKLQLSWTGNFRRDSDEPPNSYLRDWYYGSTKQADWQGEFKPAEFDTIVTGFNYLFEKGESYYFSVDPLWGTTESVFPKRFAWTKGYFMENKFNFKDFFYSNQSYRIEDHSRFNTKSTYKLDALFKVSKTGTDIKGSFATGFKAPTLYQLYAPSDPSFGGGNVSLKPEESQTYEAGFKQSLLNNKFIFGFTYFHTNFKNLIDSTYNPATFVSSQYMNVSKARAFG